VTLTQQPVQVTEKRQLWQYVRKEPPKSWRKNIKLLDRFYR